MALIGQVLDGRYKIEDVLGQGGMGMVFRATQTSVQRPVAVKTLNPSLAAAPQFFERFRREAEIASRLRHPNVITIYDFGRAQDGTCYYVMELLEGESLREQVKRDGPMSLRRAVDIIEQACRGLAHAHEQGAVHRDIKPHNIMVQQLDGRDFVKVLDFGLVKALEQEEEMQLTSTGQVLGTPQYMPPEQAGGESVDHRSDLYSMGGVLYYCLTGTSPYGANTVRKALTAALTQPPPTVASKRQGAPAPQALEDFFQKALAREKEDRFQSAQEFVDAMLDAVADLSPEELDALPTNSAPDAGGGSKPSQRSVSKPGRSSPSAARSRAPSPTPRVGGSQPSAVRAGSQPSVARGGAQPSVARGAQPASRGSQPSSVAARGGNGGASPVRQRTHSIGEETQGIGMSGVKIALVAVPLALIAAGGAFVVLRPSAPPAEPPPVAEVKKDPAPVQKPAAPAADSMLLVQIRSAPPGAAVFDGDVQIGTTPFDRQLRRNEIHELTFRLSEHQDLKRKLDFNGVLADSQEVSVTLEPAKTAPAEPSSRPSRAAKQGKDKDDSVPIFE
ncbi:serine/threonine-protein kinase [Vitiosangium sp. GDMCC 1.1324]|uniref:serine/threonine protein kinase n=1 Tax=Vitiosangium sp. (strain GDMCC 1.1324) TaxID=2138576 RepID=UPI001E286C48|nr:serine/threonine-protein kinase [Vitiosangium sp. GDMCC 1.1324]